MHKTHQRFHSVIPTCIGIVAILAIIYIGLIATVMSYAATTVDFSQSVRNDEAAVSILDAQYFADISSITNTDYVLAGYAKPVQTIFVPGASQTAIR